MSVFGFNIIYFIIILAVALKTRTRDRTFEGGRGPLLPLVQPRPYLFQFWLNYAKSPKHAQLSVLNVLVLCMQDTFALARTRPKAAARPSARDDRVSYIQWTFMKNGGQGFKPLSMPFP